MKTIYYFIVLLVFSACSEIQIEVPPIGGGDCLGYDSFTDTYHHFQTDSNIFFVKGIPVGETISYWGRRIKVIEDIKGNFEDYPSIVLWSNTRSCDECLPPLLEDLSKYTEKDTLILLMRSYI
ncbi:MAG: hypothetical protein BGO29_05190 [Bacteroidales bacterium 36-12]|nr:MAG: hypothetical protein BGO29_05190 [Bacteroidales bacterium 36-12]